ncbi:MAG: hypothetical protein WEC84_01995 [Candidatus Andersenbacteria bacterium]
MDLYPGKLRGLKIQPCTEAENAFEQVCAMADHVLQRRLSEVQNTLYTEDLYIVATDKGRIVSAALVEEGDEFYVIQFLLSSPMYSLRAQGQALEQLLLWILKRNPFRECAVRLVDQKELKLQKRLLKKLKFRFTGVSGREHSDEMWERESPTGLDSPWHPVNRVEGYYTT